MTYAKRIIKMVKLYNENAKSMDDIHVFVPNIVGQNPGQFEKLTNQTKHWTIIGGDPTPPAHIVLMFCDTECKIVYRT